MSYLELHKKSGLKVGDLVEVTRKAEDYECGWGCRWHSRLDSFVGGTFNIVEDAEENGFLLYSLEQESGFYFPSFVLAKKMDTKQSLLFSPGEPVKIKKKAIPAGYSKEDFPKCSCIFIAEQNLDLLYIWNKELEQAFCFKAKHVKSITKNEAVRPKKNSAEEEIPQCNDFSNACVGDEVYDLLHGKGKITEIVPNVKYPIKVIFSEKVEIFDSYTIDGRPSAYGNRTLYKEKPDIVTGNKVKKTRTYYANYYAKADKIFLADTFEECVKSARKSVSAIGQKINIEWYEEEK